MVSRWRRLATGAGLALVGLLLTGCRAEGTFEVLSEERVAVDLTISDTRIACPGAVDALKLTITRTTDASGAPACHVTGITQATYFSPFGIDVSAAAEYLVLQAGISGGRDSWPPADITIRFPGQVVQSNQGFVAGNTVRLTDLGPVAEGSGLRVVALGRPGPPAWALGVIGGAVAGIAVALIVLFGRRLLGVPRRPTPGMADGVSAASGAGAAATSDPIAPATAPDGGNPGTAPPAAGPPNEFFAPGQEDTTWFARAPAEPPSAPAEPARGDRRASGGALHRRPRPDHSVWAPPADD